MSPLFRAAPLHDNRERSAHQKRQEKLRATQTLVNHMSFCWNHPTVLLLELGWRWLLGIPFLAMMWLRLQQVLLMAPPESVGLDKLNFQNPWLSSFLLAEAAHVYRPVIVAACWWLLPAGVLAWAILAGIGRTLVLRRMASVDVDPSLDHPSLTSSFRHIPGMIVLQGAWIVMLIAVFYLWDRCVGWAASTHINSATEPDLIGFFCWVIFFSLAMFVAWALLSWTLATAPLLYLREPGRGIFSALLGSAQLGKDLSSKLLEVNLVMGIVKIALVVLAMVFSAAPLPFSDEFGPGALHFLYVVIFILFLVGNDFFHVVRLRSFSVMLQHNDSSPA